MISIFVTIQIRDGFVDQFKEASFGDSQGSVRDEHYSIYSKFLPRHNRLAY